MSSAPTYKRPKKLKHAPVRLFSRGVITGYRRGLRDQDPSITLVKMEGVNSKTDTPFYIGKRIAYIYKAKTMKKGSRMRIVWGTVRRHHGNAGVLRTKFKTHLPPSSFGRRVRLMLYPSKI